MPVPTTLESLSTTAASNGPAGSEQRTLADDGLRQAYAFIRQLVTLGSNIASASSITPPSTGSSFNITGTTSITAIASTNSWDGRVVTLIFAGALTLTHSSNLALPGSVSITTAANDVALFIQTGSGAWRCLAFQRSAGGVVAATYAFAGDENNSWSAPSADVQAWNLAGSEAMRLSSTGLGLGNAAVYKVTAYTGGAAASYLQAANGTTGVTSSDGTLFGVDASGNGVVNVQDALSLLLKTSGTTRGEANAAGEWGLNCTPVATVAFRAQLAGSNDVGIEWTRISATAGQLQSYNRNGAAYTTLRFDAADYVWRTSGTERLGVTSDGRHYGTALHNNAGDLTGTTNQYIASGTYTPTYTGVANVAASVAALHQWVRVGNVVTVSGGGTIDPTANSATTTLGISLPIASNFSAAANCSGAAYGYNGSSEGQKAGISADTTNDRAELSFVELASGANNTWTYSFTYLVL